MANSTARDSNRKSIDHAPLEKSDIPAAQAHIACQQLPLQLDADEPLRLQIFIDRSIIEVFANNRQCLTQRLYQPRPDSR